MKTNILHNMIKNVRVWAIMMVCLTVFGVGNAWGAITVDSNPTTSGDFTITCAIGNGSNAPVDQGNFIRCYANNTITIESSGAAMTQIDIAWTKNSSKAFADVTADCGEYSHPDGAGTGTWEGSATTVVFTVGSSGQIQITEVTITTVEPYTVTFNAQGGTCATASLTEASGGAGVTLPAASPSATCASEGWEFAGWATAKCSESSAAPRLYVDGATYYPSDDVTLHAVYRKEDDGSTTSTATFTASTLSGLTTIASNATTSWWWLHTASGVEFYIEYYAIYSGAFNIDNTEGDDSGWALLEAHRRIKQVVLTLSNSSNSVATVTPDAGTAMLSTSSTTQTITCTGDVTALELVPNTTNNEANITTFTVTYYNTTFNSTPSCCDNIVGISESGSSHASMTFSQTSVPTCGSGADDRKVTITVTPASGYSLFGPVKPIFTKTSGTVTATIGDLVDNGDGTFSYECQFAQDDSGAGTFAITAGQFTNYLTVCPSDLTLTGPTGDIVFITSTASKTVRSQEAFHIEGYGLTRSQELSFDFGSDDLNGKFAFKKANGNAISTDASGAVDEDIYVFYTPGSGSSDGLDVSESVTASVSGVKSEEYTLDTKTIIGRHLPANFVIAGKKEDNKWYAMPANMSSTTNPKPSEIIVDDINNPSLAYTAASNIYSMEGPTASNISGSKGDYIRFVMTPLWVDDEDHSKGHAPLFGSATSNNEIGKSGNSQATSDLNSGGWWWKLVQTNTSITNPQDAKYTIYNHNNTSSLSLRDNAGNPDWGLFASGVSELRLIPAQTADVVEAYFVEWGTNGGVIEVDAEGISATKVKAKFKGSSSTKSLSQTLTSGGKASKYDYTVAFDGIDLSAADAVGNILLLEWYEEDDDLAGVTSISVPKIISGNYTMMGDGKPSKTDWEGYDEVHVLPSAKLTANTAGMSGYGMTLKHLEIYQGATVIITSGSNKGTLTVTDLVLRNGWSRAGSKRYDVARLYIKPYESDSKKASSLVATNAYADWYIDFDQYYPIAVPWDVTIPSGLSYRYCTVSATVGHDNNIRLRYYDGEGRAAGTNAGTSNWKDYGKGDNKAMPAKLVPAQGYVMSAKRPTGKAFSIIRMTLTIPSATWTADGEQEEVSGTHKNQVSVGAWGKDDASKPWYAKCWNYIANPYMAVFTDDRKDDSNLVGKLLYENGGSVRYATIPDADFKGFNQVNINEAELKPSSGFLVQVASTCTLTFSNSEIVAPSAPMRYTVNQEAIPEQEAYIRLSGESGTDQMGLVIGSDYTADYEINADLSKMIGEANIVKTWMRYTDMEMAYVAINEQLAREWIPVIVKIPAEGEYTYSLKNSSTVDNLEGLYLIDYQTGVTTNLLFDDYTFMATETGTVNGRFAINAIVGNHKVPTSADITGLDTHSNEPIKFIWHDQVYILHGNVIYDSTGKRVNVINK